MTAAVRGRGPDRAPRKFWTKADMDLLAELYPSCSTVEIAQRMERSIIACLGMANKLGLKKTQQYLRKYGFQKGSTIGSAYRFKKGQVPSNKGLRRPGYHAGRMRETQFKPGHKSGKAAENWRPIGAIAGDSEGYLRIKVREAIHGKEPTGFGNVKVWPLLHRRVWEQLNGSVPAGHAIAFKDGDRHNCSVENLELISRAELAHRNRMWGRMPRELADTIHLNGQLKRRIREAAENG
jgi:hypothetical protein